MKTTALFDNIMYGLLIKCQPLIVNILRKIVSSSIWLNKGIDTASDVFTEQDSA